MFLLFVSLLMSAIIYNMFMLPLNIISEIVTPFSLGMRLFGNILSGVVIMNLIYGNYRC